jgi:outer membrane lipoprotein-sorting protein
MSLTKLCAALRLAAALFSAGLAVGPVPAQQAEESSIVQHIDAAVKARFDGIESYTVTEHYAVYRNNDESHPVAEMTVKTTYLKDAGKSYSPISQSGSAIIRSQVLGAILDNEKRLNLPANREGSWITSANYRMKVNPGGNQSVDGRDCLVLSVTPRRNSPYLFNGTLWVDAKDYTIVQFQGTASKSSSLLTGPTQALRQYAKVDGFAMATRARAESNSFLFGKTVVTIDYHDYQVQLRAAR